MLLLTLLTITQSYENDKRIYDTTDDEYGNLDSLTNLEDKRKESDDLEKAIPKEIKEKHQTNERITKTLNILPLSAKENNTNLPSKKRKNRPNLKSKVEKRELEDAVEYGLKAMEELINVKEPQWYKMGLYLDKNEPASRVANFGAPGKKALELSKIGYASAEASKKIAESYPENVSRQSAGFDFESRLLQDDCPLKGRPRCPPAARRYRTADGTCNNFNKPWRGASLLPMQRFLPPVYEDGIQEIRRSVFKKRQLPSARTISTIIHQEKNIEMPSITLMFMQWGQFIDHDLVSTVKSRSFNGSVPRCCKAGGADILPPDLTHPSCLPIEVSGADWFLAPLGIRCIEFIRSAPSTRINCDLGWREQINQVTSFLDGSPIYGSDIETADAMRTFRNGRLQYGRIQGQEPLQPPDPPGGEICRFGALTSDCLQSGDGRLSEQPGLTALHIIWLRYHNKIAGIIKTINRHWGDEKIYQESRRIVVAILQHITYREFLPLVLGHEVTSLFGLNLEKKGFYSKYRQRINPSIANSFATAAFRFGHSLVQSSFVRFDVKHRPLFNNVTLHEEQQNVENIWSFGALDRLILGFCNQASQRRDEFISEELTNNLFRSPGFPFGMDLAAINIQRGRDHGLPSYTSWREPCGLERLNNWKDFDKIMNPDTVDRLRDIYDHIDDIDLFTGGLAEKPVRGGIVGPTFACIIAQQFLNLRQGDRFWYENEGFESSFTPAQLQKIRQVTFSYILCQTLTEIETIQPFAFLNIDSFKNSRISCDNPAFNKFDLTPWIEKSPNDIRRSFREEKKKKKLRRSTTVKTPTDAQFVKVKVDTKQTYGTNNYAVNDIPPRPTYDAYVDNYYDRRTTLRDDNIYSYGAASQLTTPKPTPFEVNIKIQYYPQSTTEPPQKQKRPQISEKPYFDYSTHKPYFDYNYQKPNLYSTTQRHYLSQSSNKRPYYDFQYTNNQKRQQTTDRPYNILQYDSQYSDDFSVQKPGLTNRPYIYDTNKYIYTSKRPHIDRDDFYGELDDFPRPMKHYETRQYDKMATNDNLDKFNFHSSDQTKFVKISSVKGEEYLDPSGATVQLHVSQREGDLELGADDVSEIRLVDLSMNTGETKWLIYNTTEEIEIEAIDFPDINVNISCSHELPTPIKSFLTVGNKTVNSNATTT